MNNPIQFLMSKDPVLASIIKLTPPITVTKKTDYFPSLVESIVSQQLSIKAADTIFGRFIALFRGEFPEPQLIIDMPVKKMRLVGLSQQKSIYIKDLAQKIISKELSFEGINEKSDEDVIAHLTQVKGIGRWTAEMFLMFTLGREDIFSYGDLGLKNAIQKLYGLDSHPTPQQAEEISKKWKPFRTYACRYLWASITFKLL